jgi:hypothetical protein
MTDGKCTYCGANGLEPGFVRDSGEGSKGYARWVEGALERGIFGGAKTFSRPHWKVDAYRCRQCGHLELFATEPV